MESGHEKFQVSRRENHRADVLRPSHPTIALGDFPLEPDQFFPDHRTVQ